MIDLHTHTTISDGIYSPEELVQRAIKLGLKVLCMTDHNAVNENLEQLRSKYPQIILPTGCEFSCHYKTIRGRIIRLHIGGIGFDIFDSDIQRILKHNRDSMRPYVEKILSKLQSECGIKLCTYEDLVSRCNSKTIGRKHIAVEMVRQGFSKDVDDAFDTYLGKDKPAYVSNAIYYASLSEVVAAIVGTGGIASICHLYDYNLDAEEIEGLLSYFETITYNQGAMEVYYTSYNEQQRQKLKFLADKHRLLYSAASDFHGDGKVKELGRYPYELYERMICAVKTGDTY
ncbi:PHP domain-containing protein [Ruminococcus sp. zg-924]|uniref:PHP domain-containing protein n=1 Tax=Ruminococcus sp. zg-924 TaxID=2678505 RepID=UPI002109BDE3|nr:PHP domain-containing protein [Ruminococcus sp. zg-924]